MFRVFRHYIPVRVVTLLAGDLAIFVWAAYAGVWLRFWADPMAMAAIGPIFPKALFFASVNISIAFLLGLYAAEGNPDTRDTTARVVVTGLAGAVANSALFYLIPNLSLGRGMFVLAMLAGAVVFLNWRLFFLWMMRQPGLNSRILVVGAGPAAGIVDDILSNGFNPGFQVVGYVEESGGGPRAVQTNRVFQHSENSLYRLALKERVNKIVVALGERRGAFPLKEILTCKMMGIEVLDLPTFYEQVSGRILLKDLRPSWLIFSDGFRKNATALAAKRMVDILLACVGLILALPLLPLAALAVKIDSRGTILFRQTRVGQHGRLFTLYKLRTMREDAEAETGPVWAAEGDPRVTRLGRFLRASRVDEIPQMWNVLKGEMSFIGPRPERPHFVQTLQQKIPYYTQRLTVKPGLTGWAQVRYRYGGSAEDALEKLQYDLYYIKNMSLFLDLLIAVDTSRVILWGRGAR